MSAPKNSPQNHKTPFLPFLRVGPGKSWEGPKKSSDIVISRKRAYKGGRVLECGKRFRTWREVQGYSIAKISARLEDKTREFGIDGRYLTTRLYELEQGRFKPPTWLILLLMQTYEITFPWHEFLDGGNA